MLNIRIEDGKTCIDGTGTKDNLIIECGFAMYACIDTLRGRLGKGDDFIKGVFDIALTHEAKDDD